MMNGHFLSRLMWGLFIILIGIVLMLRQSGFIDFSIGHAVSLLWPVFLLFLGFQGMVKKAADGRGSYMGSWILMIVGFAFLGRNMGWFDLQPHDVAQYFGPIIIILFGIRMIMKPKKRKDKAPSDDWKAYSYNPADEPVPPAPPLHPDPTKQSVDSEGRSGATGNADGAGHGQMRGQQDEPRSGAAAERPPYYGKHYSGGASQHPKLARLERRAERMRERMEYRAHRHVCRNDRTEWWNHDPNAQNRSGFIGDIYVGHDYWELKPMNISHFIGDTVLDLTKAQISPGETRINISSFIGDVKVFLPNDFEIGVHVVSSAFIGDVDVLDRKEGGMFKNMRVETPYFHETDKKIKLVVSTFIGDVRVTKVG